MKNTISGFAYSYQSPEGKDRLYMQTFGTSRSLAKSRLKAENFMKKIEPLKTTGLWSVQVTPLEKIHD